MFMKKFKRRRLNLDAFMLVVVIPVILAICIVKILFFSIPAQKNEPVPTASSEPQGTAQPVPSSTPEVSAQPEDNPYPDSLFTDTDSILLLANKKHPLPDGYMPSDLVVPNVQERNGTWMLRQEAATALENMFNAAAQEGVNLVLGSGFRNRDSQEELWNYYANTYGQDYADSVSSRSNYSEHQTGLAVDLCNADGTFDLDKGFKDTAEGQWLYANAHRYGFILRYPEGKQDITGYDYEPWHFRYVGIDYATAIYAVSPDETFEEYFHQTGGGYE